jgi:hypothetical protein
LANRAHWELPVVALRKLGQIRRSGFEGRRRRTAALTIFAVADGAISLVQIYSFSQACVVRAGDSQLGFGLLRKGRPCQPDRENNC